MTFEIQCTDIAAHTGHGVFEAGERMTLPCGFCVLKTAVAHHLHGTEVVLASETCPFTTCEREG